MTKERIAARRRSDADQLGKLDDLTRTQTPLQYLHRRASEAPETASVASP
jgi:hypothetical protein